ncbi:AsmA family protein [Methylovirgula sp. HY1]|uniref:AsmA family protein n=1 Tax=Methylovirgula sp. HY1 TaxID=2822761 RepID=UPI001C5B4912|nr:AsmA family protein [Methylovirgula sp. HY1]QXX75864.1 hypothetical protein MHY1_02697 [Methylovirgula sp. HY1]
MRESLTVLAILLILVLSAALAVPYFVDWNAERGLVQTQLSQVLGRPVAVHGAIDLRLLPTPYLSLADVRVGSGAADPAIKIDEIRLEMSLTALLRGEVDFVEAKAVHPQLTLQIKDDAASFGPPLHRFAGQMRFERISIENGALDLRDPATGRHYAFTNISFGAEALSLRGPFKARGRFSFAGEQSHFNFAASGRHADRQRFKLIIDANKQHPRADLDANLVFPQSRGRATLPTIDGQIKLSGRINDAIALPWQLAGTLQAGLRNATLSNLDLRFGDEDHAVDFAGAAALNFGAHPRVDMSLTAHQMDLDRLLSARDAPPAMQRLVDAFASLMQSGNLMVSGVPVAVTWSADNAVLGGKTLGRLSGGFAIAGKETASVRFAADAPGRSHLSLAGNIESGAAAGFKGHIAARADNVARLAQWLRINLPKHAALFSASPVHSFDVSGTANLSQIGFVGENLAVRLDQSMLTGTVAYTKSVGGAPARLFADLSASKVALDSVPDLSALAGRTKAMDLSLRLLANVVKVSGLGQSDLDTGQITLRLEKIGARTKLDEFAVTGLGGANITAHGQWDGKTGMIAGAIDSAKLDAAAVLFHRLAPDTVTNAFLARADALSPARFTFAAQGKRTTDGALTLENLSLAGAAGGTKIATKVAADPKDPTNLVISGVLDAPDALALIQQLGLTTLPLQGLGSGHIEIKAHGRRDEAFDTDVTAMLAATNLAFHGRVTVAHDAPHAVGKLSLTSTNLTPLLEATGLAFPGPMTRLAAALVADVDAGPTHCSLRDLAGHFAGTQIGGALGYDPKQHHLTGTLDVAQLSLAAIFELALGEPAPAPAGTLWSNAKFPAAMIDPPPTDLRLTAKHFLLTPQMSGRDASLDLGVSGGRAGLKLTLQHVAMKLGAGSAVADLTLRRDEANAAVAGHLAVSNYDLALPSLRARLSGGLDLAGTGNSTAAVFSGLAGSGMLTFTDLVLPRTDPSAMLQVFKAVEDDSLGLDGSEIDRALTAKFDTGASHLGNVAFDAGLAAGVLRLAPKGAAVETPAAGITETLQASVDLNNLTLDQTTNIDLLTLPKNWSGPPPQVTVTAKGALSNPARTIESSSFVNALAARAIARESARIQAQEFDVHEQAFFYNRLKSERRREQEKLKAEEDAKRAKAAKEEAAKKAADEKRKAEAAARAIPLPIVRPQLPHPVQMPAYRPAVPTDPLAAGRY